MQLQRYVKFIELNHYQSKSKQIYYFYRKSTQNWVPLLTYTYYIFKELIIYLTWKLLPDCLGLLQAF